MIHTDIDHFYIQPGGTEWVRVDVKNLAKCPFCGGSAYLCAESRDDTIPEHQPPPDRIIEENCGRWVFWVSCIGCACQGPWSKFPQGAVEWWNRRNP